MPILKYMLLDAKQRYDAKFIIYINSDILINPFIFHYVISASNFMISDSVEFPTPPHP